MSTYSNRLQPALQNHVVLQKHVVRFFHQRSSCTTHILADVFGGRKSLVKPVTWQKTCNYIELFSSSTRDRHAWRAYIGGRSENNIKCGMCDDLGWKNRTTRYIVPCHWLYEWLPQFHSCGTYLVLSRSPSIVLLCYTILHIYYSFFTRLLPPQAINQSTFIDITTVHS